MNYVWYNMQMQRLFPYANVTRGHFCILEQTLLARKHRFADNITI